MTDHLSLAVIQLRRVSDDLEPALTGSLLDMAGVLRVRVDSLRNAVHILYDGDQGTVESVHHFLVATGWMRAADGGRGETDDE